MNAILLVGGLGTRLRPLTLDQPKGLLPILNRPFLSYQFDLLERARVRHVVVAAGRNSKPWEAAFRRLKRRSLRIHFSYEPEPLGTGGAVRFAYEHLKRLEPRLSPEPIAVLNGDVFFELNLTAFRRFHQQKKADASLALTQVEDPSRYGVAVMGADRRLRRFVEKPQRSVGSSWINAGAYLLNPAFVESVPSGRAVSIEKETFVEALRHGRRVFGFRLQGYWNDIGTHASYLQAHRDLLYGALGDGRRRRVRGSRTGVGLVDPSAKISPHARLEGFFCVASGVRIGPRARVRDSVLFPDVKIGEDADINGAIVGPECHIPDGCVINPGTVLGRASRLRAFSRCGEI